MKQHIQVVGMTCQNCRRGVEEKIASLEGVSDVTVSLEKAEARFTSTQAVSLTALGELLGKKYTLSPLDKSRVDSSPSKWRQLRPLFLIFFYVIAGSLFLSKGESLAVFMRYFMGLFYVVFGFFKFLDYQGFPASFQQYDPLAKRFSFYAWIYPFIETALGLAFLMEFNIQIALWLTLIILGSTSTGVIQQLRQKNNLQCACLGTALNLPMTEATLIENTIMLGMAIVMLFGIV